uniref:Uncharacterized protein n=1 Tax=Zea mays TaxID=4577 RepID=C4J7J4_MAIZE|nr:unknown [Zea mays]
MRTPSYIHVPLLLQNQSMIICSATESCQGKKLNHCLEQASN